MPESKAWSVTSPTEALDAKKKKKKKKKEDKKKEDIFYFLYYILYKMGAPNLVQTIHNPTKTQIN